MPTPPLSTRSLPRLSTPQNLNFFLTFLPGVPVSGPYPTHGSCSWIKNSSRSFVFGPVYLIFVTLHHSKVNLFYLHAEYGFLLEEKAIYIPLTTIYFDGTIYVVLRILREEHRHRQSGLFLRSFVFSGNTEGADNLVGVGNRQGKVPCAIEPRHERIIGRKTQ